MVIVMYMSMIAALISMIMMTASLILSKKTMKDREKSSPFECGFDPKSSPRLPFSLQFFLIAIIFIIFDVEIALLLPLIIIMKSTTSYWYISITLSFLIILLGGLYHEWKHGALEWAL